MAGTDIIFQTPPANSVTIDDSSDIELIFQEYRNFLTSRYFWHRFEVANIGNLNRKVVLTAILDSVCPLELFPVCYARDKNSDKSYFLARNCKSSIKKLATEGFLVENPSDKDTNHSPFKIKVVLNFTNIDEFTVDILSNVLMVLQKRMKYPEQYLDLDNFAEDPDLVGFCYLAQPKIAFFVIKVAKALKPLGLILSNNNITSLSRQLRFPFELRKMDLSHNRIESLSNIAIGHLKITDLTLTGNPLCNCDEETYVADVQKTCSKLELLDGIPLRKEGIPGSKKNYLCNMDAYDLVSQFLEYFFTIYDSGDRSTLIKLYNPLAVFSLTCSKGAAPTNSVSLDRYYSLSRNVIRPGEDVGKSKLIYNGIFEIINLFIHQLPITQHDPYSFTSDLVYSTSKCSILVVTGVFRESQQDILGFMRTFVLEHLKDRSKCSILNDQLHVYKAPADRRYFTTPRFVKNVMRETQLVPEVASDTQELVVTLCKLTGLREDWARKCLESCRFDLRTALEFFLGLYKEDKFPRDAFTK